MGRLWSDLGLIKIIRRLAKYWALKRRKNRTGWVMLRKYSSSIHQMVPKWSLRHVLTQENKFIWVSAKFGGSPCPISWSFIPQLLSTEIDAKIIFCYFHLQRNLKGIFYNLKSLKVPETAPPPRLFSLLWLNQLSKQCLYIGFCRSSHPLMSGTWTVITNTSFIVNSHSHRRDQLQRMKI